VRVVPTLGPAKVAVVQGNVWASNETEYLIDMGGTYQYKVHVIQGLTKVAVVLK